MLYAAIFGIVFNVFKLDLYAPVNATLVQLGDAMVPVALMTLGIQLTQTTADKKNQTIDVTIASSLRLIISPVLSYAIALALGITGIPLQVLIISAAAPTAVNSVLLAIKYKREPEFASKVAFVTTIISSITVTFVILFATSL